ncbi:hypothetical protein OPV22_028543 [Ensete ventricosum]|uniref:Uncharacterized protein n=1 Tax=Ensete ventricosum TaxID=4639 RepID=A0AAV8P571_ENSVE|nr:hypothetical protein OPV22_028543 [Ensete ventricosum]RWW07785.1 hypothetical protein GW17_00028815 [Ensete ventricosum]RWW71460.1 hypothetical protein BHE74_00020799 [Ensete ventricosum]
MERNIDEMCNGFDEVLAAAGEVMQAREASFGLRTTATEAALKKFRQRCEVFKLSCDRAEDVVDSARRSLMAERVMDEASGMAPGQPETAGLPLLNVPRFERALQKVNSVAEDLRHGSAATAASSSSRSPPATPSEDKAD